MSDNSEVSKFQQSKLYGGKKNEVLRRQKLVEEMENQLKTNLPPQDNSGNAMPYSKNILNTLTDQNAAIKVSKNPSNLVEVPRVHEKYEINSFTKSNP